jgi:hypothetical protein
MATGSGIPLLENLAKNIECLLARLVAAGRLPAGSDSMEPAETFIRSYTHKICTVIARSDCCGNLLSKSQVLGHYKLALSIRLPSTAKLVSPVEYV